MAWTDFNYYPTSGLIHEILDPMTPIVGTGSLRIERVSGTAPCALTWASGAGLRRGAIRGRRRILLKALEISSLSAQYGLTCMQSAHDISVSGMAYALRVRGSNIDLIKITNGIATDTSLATMDDGLSPPWSETQIVELVWVADQQGIIGGTYLEAWWAASTIPGDLTRVLRYLDISAPLTTSVNEGGFVVDSGTGMDFQFNFDSLLMEGPP